MRRGGLSLGLVLLLGCERDAPPADEPEPETCELSAPTLIVAAPPDRPEQNDVGFLQVAGDRLVYSWGQAPVSSSPIYLSDRCGRESMQIDRQELDLTWYFPRTTASGPRLYGVDPRTGVLSMRDRVDVPGEDEPVALGDFRDLSVRPFELDGHLLFITVQAQNSPKPFPAAGVGARAETIWTHSGDPNDPLVRLTDDVVNFPQYERELGWPLVLLNDAGDARLLDLDAGVDRPLLTGARAVYYDRAHDQLLWQRIDDDGDESVLLRGIDGDDLALLATVDFDPNAPALREWSWSHDGAHVGLIAAEETFESVFSTADGTSVELPAHVSARTPTPGGFWLTLVDDDTTRADALWDPHSGELFEFHRGGSDEHPTGIARTGDVIEYFLFTGGPDDSLWTVDRATGQRAQKLPRIQQDAERLADGRLLTTLYDANFRLELVLIDPERAHYETLASGVSIFSARVPGGVYYIQIDGPSPGIWFAPLP